MISAPWPESFSNIEFAYLTTWGRNSGKPHRIEIWFALYQGKLLLMSGGQDRSDWVQNLIANPEVSVEIGTITKTGTASVLSRDTDLDRIARDLLVAKYQKNNNLTEWNIRSLGVVIEFPPAANESS